MNKRSFLLACTAASVLILSACAPIPLKQPAEQSVSSNFTESDVHEAIIKAATLRKWRIVSDKPGVVTLAYPSNNRSLKYEMIAEVPYSATSYRVRYLSSYGLDEKPNCDGSTPCLHRNVNKWLANLSMDIQRYLFSNAYAK